MMENDIVFNWRSLSLKYNFKCKVHTLINSIYTAKLFNNSLGGASTLFNNLFHEAF